MRTNPRQSILGQSRPQSPLFFWSAPRTRTPLDKGSEGSGDEIVLGQSRTQSLHAGFLVSRATPGRLWGHRILLPRDFCGKTMETVTGQPIKKIEFFRCPQSLPGVAPLTKKPEDSGYEIGFSTVSHLATAHSFCASRDARRNPVF